MMGMPCGKRITPVVVIVVCLLSFLGRALGQDKSLDELMNLSLTELASVTVTTPAKTSQKLSEIPGTVRIITERQIGERGYITLDEALADLPGFQFRDTLGFNSYVFMRGVPNQNNLIIVMIDGVQINELNSGGFYGGGQYNLANVERIEVVYGPASAMYGTNAVSGVINIITKKPADVRGVRLDAMAGGFNSRLNDFTYGFYDETGEIGLNISGMFRRSDKADLRGAAGDNNWSSSMENFEDDKALDAKIEYKRLTVGLNYQDKQTSYSTKDRILGTSFQDFGTLWHIRFMNTYAKYDFQKSGRWSWHSLAYCRDATVPDDTLLLIKTAAGGDPGYQEKWYRPNRLVGLENRYNRELGPKLSAVIGTVSERESLSNGFSKSRSGSQFTVPQAPAGPVMLDNSLSSVYAQLQWRLSDPVSLTAGTRFDSSDVYGRVVTPRAGIVYNRKKFNAKASYAEAYRAPKDWDYKDGLGNPGLSPEEMKSAELSAGYSFTERLRGEVSIYRNTLNNCLARENVGASWRWANLGMVKVTGLESGLEYHKDRWKSYLNFTCTGSLTQNGVIVPEISPYTANAGVQYAFTGRLKLDLRGQYLGGRKNTHAVGAANDMWVDHAFVAHGTLSLVNYRGYDVQLAARNIFDREYYHTSNTSVSRYRQPQFSTTLKVGRRF